ncbi:MAG: hypothetical protein AAFY52_00735 [Pseudomonadota bacterium]
MQCETVEIARIKLRPHVTEAVFLGAFQQFLDGFVRHQPGFVSCQLLKKDAGRYLDLVHWATLADARNAFERSSGNDACVAFFGLLDADETDPDAGVEYLATVTPDPAEGRTQQR